LVEGGQGAPWIAAMEDGLSFQGSFGKHAQHGVHLQQEHVLSRKATQQAEAIVSAQAPYRIKSVNDAWVELFGFRCGSSPLCKFVRTGHAQTRGGCDSDLPSILHSVSLACRGCAPGGISSKQNSILLFGIHRGHCPKLLGATHLLLGCLCSLISHTISVRIARSAYQAHGRSLALVQGPGTDGMAVNFLIKHAALGMSHSSTVNFYTRTGEPVNMLLQVSPLGTDDIRIVMIPTQAGESSAISPAFFVMHGIVSSPRWEGGR
jgi:hypothetical protein